MLVCSYNTEIKYEQDKEAREGKTDQAKGYVSFMIPNVLNGAIGERGLI